MKSYFLQYLKFLYIIIGFVAFVGLVCLFYSYSSVDYTLMQISNQGKFLHRFSFHVANLFMQYFGIIAYIFPTTFLLWSLFKFFDTKFHFFRIIASLLVVVVLLCTFCSVVFNNYENYYDFLIGGFVGFFIKTKYSLMAKPLIIPWIMAILGLIIYIYASGLLAFLLHEYIIKNEQVLKKVQTKKPKINKNKHQEPHLQDNPNILISGNGYIPPSLDLLSDSTEDKEIFDKNTTIARSTNAALMQVLSDFGINGEIVDVKIGPILTVFELEPESGVRSNRIIGLSDDIARYLKAVSCRITLIPGKSTIAIEVPNKFRQTLMLKDILCANSFVNSQAILPIALGNTTDGEPIVVDLAKMPHLLIAGTTGSGKSVGVNSIILSILYRLSPDDCRFIMIDPKMLELSVYDGIPYLLTPVITDPGRAVIILKWLVKEMERRYKLMSAMGVRNIIGYNDSRDASTEKMPYIVLIVDEMADLMITAGKVIEASIQRLAQMARASGIHLILATQRPSVDVITGIIKANFPIRVSYQVASSTDSRTILGYMGAEKLLGKGDMLYMPTGGKSIRLHGPFVSDEEVTNVVKYLKANYEPNYDDSVENFISAQVETSKQNDDITIDSDDYSGNTDDLYQKAIEIVRTDKKTSISYVQRRLKIGYNKAADLIERMQNDGILTPPDSSGKRVIIN